MIGGISSKRVKKLAKKSTPPVVKTTAKQTNKKIVKRTECKKIGRNVNWRSIRTRLSPHQMLMGLDAMSKKQKVAVKKIGLGSILNLKTGSLPSKLSHFVVDNFRGKEMVIKLDASNIKVDEDVISGLLGLKNSGVVLNHKRKEKKKGKKDKTKKDKKKEKTNEHNEEQDEEEEHHEEEEQDEDKKCGTYAKWTQLYEGRAITPSRIVERMIDNQDEDGIFFKYDFLALFMNTMVETKKDGTCETEFLKCLGEDIAMIYADQTVCGDINSIRTMSPLSFWTKDMLSRRQKYEIKNGGFGKGVLREGYVEDKVANEMDEIVEHDSENDVRDIGGKGYNKMAENDVICDGENQSVSFEVCIIHSLVY
ncbi:hypothetical protein HanPI659440_Chr15g0585651 [Helianthus annuus]|nr:hypothetical protein HanPI659440_Chr15g0585651 [Helianthus annuus]